MAKAPPLVLLHGGFGLTSLFGPFLPALAERHQVIAVELQGHGHTADIERPLRCESMAEDIAALLRHLGHERADVVGYSLGASVALRLAIQHPSAVHRLVVVSAPFSRQGWFPEIREDMTRIDEARAALLMRSPAHVVEFFGKLGGGQRDGGWDGSGMSRARLALLPGRTHYNVLMAPEALQVVLPFLAQAAPG